MTADRVDIDNIALFDMDGSLADYEGQLAKDMELLRSPNEEEFYLYDQNAPEWFKNRITLIKSKPGWWLNLPRIGDGFQIYHLAESIKGPRNTHNAWTEKLQWCQRELGELIDVTVTFNKGRYYGKVLFDDYPEYMEAWLKHRKNGLGIMLDNPSNGFFSHPHCVRWDGTNLQEVERALKIAYERKPGERLVL
jgi:5'-nucleotidase